MNKNVIIKGYNNNNIFLTGLLMLHKCPVYLFSAALSELIFVLHKDALFHYKLHVSSNTKNRGKPLDLHNNANIISLLLKFYIKHLTMKLLLKSLIRALETIVSSIYL